MSTAIWSSHLKTDLMCPIEVGRWNEFLVFENSCRTSTNHGKNDDDNLVMRRQWYSKKIMNEKMLQAATQKKWITKMLQAATRTPLGWNTGTSLTLLWPPHPPSTCTALDLTLQGPERWHCNFVSFFWSLLCHFVVLGHFGLLGISDLLHPPVYFELFRTLQAIFRNMLDKPQNELSELAYLLRY